MLLICILVIYSIFPFINTFENYTASNDYFIVSIRETTEIEDIFLQTIVRTDIINTDDPVCNLNKEKKISLCERIFGLHHYSSDLKIYISKIASFMTPMTCEIKTIRLRTKNKTDDGQKIFKKMYPCYGRHDVVQTSFIEDNYYAKFYLSAGSTTNSVLVYIYEYDADCDWFSVYDYLQNVEFNNLINKTIELKEITQELRQNKSITENNNISELINILQREEGHYKTDAVCEMGEEQKLALCKLLFDQDLYKNKFKLRLNHYGFLCFDVDCLEKPIKVGENLLTMTKAIYPCFSQSLFDSYEHLKIDESIKPIYVSSGPRKDSVFVYFHSTNEKDEHEFILLEMYENIRIKNLRFDMLVYRDDNLIKYCEMKKSLIQIVGENEILKAKQLKSLMENKREIGIKKLQTDTQLDAAQYLKKLAEFESKMKLDYNKLKKARIAYVSEFIENLRTGDQIYTLEKLNEEYEKQLAITKTLKKQQIISHSDSKKNKNEKK